MWLRVAVPCLALSLLTARVSRAQTVGGAAERREARERFAHGLELAEQADYDGAMAEFQRVYAITHEARVLYNIGLVFESLGRRVEGVDAERRLLRDAPAAYLRRHRREAEDAIARMERNIGAIVIDTPMPELSITIDGAPVDAASARAGVRVNAGRRRVTLAAPGYVSVERTFDVAGLAHVEIREPLAHVRSAIAIDSNVEGAEVAIDGVVAGRTPIESPLVVDEGLHHVEVHRDGYTSFATEVRAIGLGAHVSVQLGWADPIPPAIAATLVVRTTEPSAHASVDHRRIGSQGTDPLPPGRHRVRVERADFVTVERTVDLPAGQSTTVDVRLEPTPAFRASVGRDRHDAHVRGGAIVALGAAATLGAGIWFAVQFAFWLGDNDRLSMLSRQIRACGGGDSCMPLYDQQRRAIDDQNLQVGLMAVSGAITGIGVAAVIVGGVVYGHAPPADRFSRPPRWFVGFAPRGVAFGASF